MTVPTPASLRRLCRGALPAILGASDGKGMMKMVEEVVRHDRWNSFDRFHDTTRVLVEMYEKAGAGAEVTPVQTGGRIGTGRWIIQEAQDVSSATLDVVRPFRERVADYRDNPWHAVQWTAATPRGGLRCELVVVDDEETLDRMGPDGLEGRAVLTRLDIRSRMERFAQKGAAAVIMEKEVANNPGAVAWIKFGWGAVPMNHATAKLVGLVVSRRQGDRLRGQLRQHGRLVVQVRVDARRYVGTHDVVCGLVPGRDDPQDEVWAIAHSAEPGAVDNASGCAVTVEIARALEGLIASGALPRPRRTIRLINGYECYGFFAYLERVKRLQPPLAGVCIDTLGSRPGICDGRLEWRSTVPGSAGFVDWIGEKILRSTLRQYRAAGYHLALGPFMATSDTLIGDPQYGYPCPWITNHHKRDGSSWDAYHTSADQLELLSPAGLKTCAAAMAAYLYYLADAATPEVVEIARSETDRLTGEVRAHRRRLDGDGAEFLRRAHETSLTRLQRWLWGGDRREVMAELGGMSREMGQAAASVRRRGPAIRSTAALRRIPRRKALLTPTTENLPAPVAREISGARQSPWALYWADGRRTLAEITAALAWERGGLLAPGATPKRGEVRAEDVVRFFEAHAEIDYVDLPERREMVGKARIVADLRRLGVERGMDLMVHSSLSEIGHVEGGADTVVTGLLEAVGSKGTLLMPSFNHRAAQVYNKMATPTTNGAIPDAFWRRPAAVRSEHPTHAVAALGPRAERYCASHLEAGIWEPESPIGQLVHGGGWILALGTTHWTSTAYHVAEMSVPCGCIDPFGNIDRVVGGDGRVEEVWGLAFRKGACPVEISPKLDDALDRRGLQRRGKVGEAESELVRAEDLWRVRREHLRTVCPTCRIAPSYRDG